MKVKIIVAIDSEFGIGKNNNLMWFLPVDMKFFKETTKSHIVVMGRKSYESIPEKYKPLPGRENIILTRQDNYLAPGCVIFNSLQDCLNAYSGETERDIYIIGGGEIYKESINMGIVDEMYITHVANNFYADTFFPKVDLEDWDLDIILSQKIDLKHDFEFVIKRYTKVKN